VDQITVTGDLASDTLAETCRPIESLLYAFHGKIRVTAVNSVTLQCFQRSRTIS
jgi:hypothetical protein